MRRIKTRKEMIEEFGHNWRSRLNQRWNYDDMDYLLGQELSPQQSSNLEKDGNIEIGRWQISTDATTLKPLPTLSSNIKELLSQHTAEGIVEEILIQVRQKS